MFPTADQIALAIVAACNITKDGPMATCMRQPSRARNIAMQSLIELFPEARKPGLARCVGYAKPQAWQPILIAARSATYWRDDWVDEVVGALVDRFPNLSPSHGETA